MHAYIWTRALVFLTPSTYVHAYIWTRALSPTTTTTAHTHTYTQHTHTHAQHTHARAHTHMHTHAHTCTPLLCHDSLADNAGVCTGQERLYDASLFRILREDESPATGARKGCEGEGCRHGDPGLRVAPAVVRGRPCCLNQCKAIFTSVCACVCVRAFARACVRACVREHHSRLIGAQVGFPSNNACFCHLAAETMLRCNANAKLARALAVCLMWNARRVHGTSVLGIRPEGLRRAACKCHRTHVFVRKRS